MPKPREFLRYQNQFGRADPAEWTVVAHEQEPLRRAAVLQHDLVREARHQQDRLDQATNLTAELINMNPDQLRRIYRGEAGLTVENLYKIARAVGLDVKVVFDKVD